MMTIRVALVLLLLSLRLWAHDPGLGSANIVVGGNEISVQLLLAPADFESLALTSPEAITERGTKLEAMNGQPLEVIQVGKRLEGQDVEVSIRYRRPEASGIRYAAALIDRLPLGHRQVLTVRDQEGSLLLSRLLSSQDFVAEIPLPAADAVDGESSGAEGLSAIGFFRLGIEHILTGYDHLLFLFALLLVCDGFRSAAKIITCFTLAHSVTLGLATFDVVRVVPAVVEPLIAASVVYVGIENLIFKKQRRWRYVLTCVFGLIHGLGFAGVLRELGMGASGLAVAGPLFSFNLGVEVGQLAIAALVLPLLLWLGRQARYRAVGVPALSLLIAGAGAYWLIERTLF